MGAKQTSNFERRFKRGFMIIPEKPLEGAARSAQNQKVLEAVKAVLAGILNREPTPHELSGCEPVSHKRRP